VKCLTAALLLATACGSGGSSIDAGPAPDAPPEIDSAAAADAATDLTVPPDAAPDLARDYPPPPVAYARPRYVHLAETGIFGGTPLAPAVDLLEFKPTHVLWSDGADKRRWLRLPPGTRIDTSDMNHWVFPIGTQLFKEFSRNGVKLETRLIERYGPDPEDYWMGAFVWTGDQGDAVFAEDGAKDINGTNHDAPPQKLCRSCHAGDAGRVLGFSALQLSREDSGMTLEAAARAGLLSSPPPAGARYRAPGDEPTAAALGYLHANCGHCHNPLGTSWPDTTMLLRLDVGETTPEATGIYRSAIGQKLTYFRHPTITTRVVPGDPEASAVIFRMKSRVMKEGMPPIATEIVDPVGIDLVTHWIQSLPSVGK
jgi:hypothetical protein